MSSPRARFVTVEGIDGAGKSTHVEWIAAALRARGHRVVVTREPGGTPLGEALRELLLSRPMALGTEALLMFAARHENICQVIRPALADGAWVLSDRFTDASFAYQGAGKGLSLEKLRELEKWVCQDLTPDLTLLFDLDTASARQRLAQARDPDKFEREDGAFFERVRQGYLERAQAEPSRIKLIDGALPIEVIRKRLEEHLATL